MQTRRRQFRLIRPRLQIHLMLSFLGVSVMALLVQYLVFMRVVTELASELPEDGALVMGELPGRLMWVLFGSSALLLPSILYVGVLTTRRIVGPIHRFETFLKQVLAGETSEECRLRKGDELLELCALINRATEGLRKNSEKAALVADAARQGPRAAA